MSCCPTSVTWATYKQFDILENIQIECITPVTVTCKRTDSMF